MPTEPSTITKPLLSREQLRKIRDNMPNLSNRNIDQAVDIGGILNTLADALETTQVATITGTITAAQVAALNATPVEVIPAPAAGFWIEVIDVDWLLDFNSSAYDAAAVGDTLGLKYTNGSGAQTVDVIAGNAIGAAAADYRALSRGLTEVNHTAADGAAVVAHLDAGEWGTGDSPLVYSIRYRVRASL